MPELPEVETIVRTLEKSLLNEKVESIEFLYPKLLEVDSPYPLETLLNKRFTQFSRRGKYLIFTFDDSYHWIIHLRMEGKFHLYKKETPLTKHTHLVMILSHNVLHYLDVRKFSRMAVVQDVDAYFEKKNLGLEPFDPRLTPTYLKEKMGKSERAVKGILLDQSIVTGIGNIYADEILFETKINPNRKGTKLRKKDYEALVEAIPMILNQAIAQGGTTIRSYTSALNVSGRFQVALKAYGQYGQPCVLCETEMSKTKIAGRTTVYCHNCQK